jgi:hypothetical protein
LSLPIRRDGEERSVVDWAVYTTSWVDDPEEERRRDWLRGSGEDRRVLSQRPLDVLVNGLNSLEGLLTGAQKLEGAPRSQLRYLVDQLPGGRVLSDLAFAELSEEARGALVKAGIGDSLWCKSEQRGPWITALLRSMKSLALVVAAFLLSSPTSSKTRMIRSPPMPKRRRNQRVHGAMHRSNSPAPSSEPSVIRARPSNLAFCRSRFF